MRQVSWSLKRTAERLSTPSTQSRQPDPKPDVMARRDSIVAGLRGLLPESGLIAEPLRLTPDPYGVGDQNKAAVWGEFLLPDTAEVVASFDHPYWKFPAITRNRHGSGTLTYEGTVLTDALQREVIHDVLKRAGLAGADQKLPAPVRVRHGRNGHGKLLHYYLNFSGSLQAFTYPYRSGSDVLTGAAVASGATVTLKPWDLAIVMEP